MYPFLRIMNSLHFSVHIISCFNVVNNYVKTYLSWLYFYVYFSSQEYLKAKPNLMLSTNPSSVVFDLTTESTLALVPSSHDLKGIALHPWL